MIKNWKKFNESGIYIPIDILNPNAFYLDKIEKDIKEEFLKGKKQGIYWEYNEKKISISDKNGSIEGFPLSNLQYIVAIFRDSQTYPYPNNAVILNLDGTLEKILTFPSFKSEIIIEEIEKHNEANPPLKSSLNGKRFCFSHYSRYRSEKQIDFDIIDLDYGLDYTESQILDLNTLECTDFLKTRFDRSFYWNQKYKL
ncbi:hypothetical protein [Flavobacterium notoginsengisoli]|uniref:hypothetical protein n=1 Tax=Flavobacterium notoginsengisoli TaxID=1478199 RepID=UPI00362D239F